MHWFERNTFAPGFLPSPLQRPVLGYLAAICLQVIVVVAKVWLGTLYPSLHFMEVFLILIVVLISLGWGAAPGVFATLTGAGLLAYFIAPPYFSFAIAHVEDAVGILLYIVVGLTISLLASQVQRARTEVEHAHQRADARARELEATFEAMSDGVVIYNADGRMLQINSAYRELIGLDKNPLHATLSPAERGAMLALRDERGRPLTGSRQPVQRMLSGERYSGAKAMDVQMHALDGREIQLSITGTPLYDLHHQLTGGVLVFRDVTERRQLERRTHDALEALLAMTEVLVHHSDDASAPETAEAARTQIARRLVELTSALLGCQVAGIFTVEPESFFLHPIVVVGFSPQVERQFYEQIEHASLPDYFSPPALQQLSHGEPILAGMSEPASAGMPTYGVRSVLVAPMRVGEQLIGVLALDYHTTEHRYPLHEEMSLIAAIGKLAAVVIERERLTRERTEAQAAELAAREANRLKDEFIGIAGHELRTPLTTIKVSVQLAKRQVDRVLQHEHGLPPELMKLLLTVASFLERTERQVGVQNRLVSDLLDVSRIETGRLELHPELHNIVTLVGEVVEDQHILTPERTVTLTLDTPEELLVTVDADRVRQVVSNYLSNALKYSGPDKPVYVSIARAGARVRVSVRDVGPGLTPVEQQRIWQRFYRAPGIEVRSGSGVGLGLGLHISRTLIERQGGRVGVESEPGVGSTFWFTLPLAEQEVEEDRTESNEHS